MVFRRPREISEKGPLIDALGRCRKRLTDTQGKVAIDSTTYHAAGRIVDGIDVLAKVLTGDERFFHASGSVGPGPKWIDQGRDR